MKSPKLFTGILNQSRPRIFVVFPAHEPPNVRYEYFEEVERYLKMFINTEYKYVLSLRRSKRFCLCR